MGITVGGLATGMDTNGLISQLLQVERQPLYRLEDEKDLQNDRLDAFQNFDDKLDTLLEKVEKLGTSSDLIAKKATPASEDFFTATATGDALPGIYEIKVKDLAQVQKSVSQGYVDKTAAEFGTGTLSLTVGTDPAVDIAIDSTNNTLEGVAAAINAADAGVTASIINDGTGTPYRLILSGEDVATSFSLDASGLSGGTYANPTLTDTQTAQQAHIVVDGIDIYGSSNTLTEAIPGVSLDLVKEELGTRTMLTVGTDEEAIKDQVKEFVTAYNAVATGANKELLEDDSGVRGIKRQLQRLLTSSDNSRGLFELGVETQKDGTLSIDDDDLTEAIQTDLAGVESLLTGTDGIATQFISYLEEQTDFSNGFYAGRKDSIDSTIRMLDLDIERVELRLDQREQSLIAQFSALEQLVSAMNTQSNYLAQQMSMLNNMWSAKK